MVDTVKCKFYGYSMVFYIDDLLRYEPKGSIFYLCNYVFVFEMRYSLNENEEMQTFNYVIESTSIVYKHS